MDIRPLDATLSASPQIAIADLKAALALGYRSVLSNRPDGEETGQVSAAEVAAEAQALGLGFRHIPVTAPAIGPNDVAAFRAALADLPGPILGFCRTGTRTTMLWALASVGERPAQDILAIARAAGYDLSGMAPRLETDAG